MTPAPTFPWAGSMASNHTAAAASRSGASPPRGVAVLGASGSVGRSAVAVLEEQRARFPCRLLAAARNGTALLAQARRLAVPLIAIVSEEAAIALRPSLRRGDPEVLAGEDALLEAIRDARIDTVVQAISGAGGLRATLEAVRAGKRVALANKESLVVAGPLLCAEARRSGALLLPIDSEHAALAQCLEGRNPADVRRVILTASGGPFRGLPRGALASVRPEQALSHPTWKMGPRITVDSATLMNKALEVIEARWLFDLAPEQIQVVVHPESVVHGLVELADGSVLAQMGTPDMRQPIRWALGWPERLSSPEPPLDLARLGRLTFESPDAEAFPALELGFEAARRGGTAGAALNGADEVAVVRFLAGDLSFPDIASHCARVLAEHPFQADPSFEDLWRVDAWARNEVPIPC